VRRHIQSPLHHETGRQPTITQSEQGEDDEEHDVAKVSSAIGDVARPEQWPEQDAQARQCPQDFRIVDDEESGSRQGAADEIGAIVE